MANTTTTSNTTTITGYNSTLERSTSITLPNKVSLELDMYKRYTNTQHKITGNKWHVDGATQEFDLRIGDAQAALGNHKFTMHGDTYEGVIDNKRVRVVISIVSGTIVEFIDTPVPAAKNDKWVSLDTNTWVQT